MGRTIGIKCSSLSVIFLGLLKPPLVSCQFSGDVIFPFCFIFLFVCFSLSLFLSISSSSSFHLSKQYDYMYWYDMLVLLKLTFMFIGVIPQRHRPAKGRVARCRLQSGACSQERGFSVCSTHYLSPDSACEREAPRSCFTGCD